MKIVIGLILLLVLSSGCISISDTSQKEPIDMNCTELKEAYHQAWTNPERIIILDTMKVKSCNYG